MTPQEAKIWLDKQSEDTQKIVRGDHCFGNGLRVRLLRTKFLWACGFWICFRVEINSGRR
jgi:hypothetical protein